MTGPPGARRGRRGIGRRALFFWLASLVCVALVPATPRDLRYVTWATAALGFFWAILLSLEDLLTPRPADGGSAPRMGWQSEPVDEMPFDPPPAPGRQD
jgi:hypothetical protein